MKNKGQDIIRPEQWKNLKSKPQILKQDHPQSYGMQFQHYKMVYQCILYVLFQDIETGFHSVLQNPFVFFFGLNPSKVLVDITIVDKSWKTLSFTLW